MFKTVHKTWSVIEDHKNMLNTTRSLETIKLFVVKNVYHVISEGVLTQILNSRPYVSIPLSS